MNNEEVLTLELEAREEALKVAYETIKDKDIELSRMKVQLGLFQKQIDVMTEAIQRAEEDASEENVDED